ncbi:MAG: hypothetical protein Q4G68_05955 [Planctomycetia bacterium]|nr:hypothetical protein [Planctomycetia bacterium]
MKNLPVHGIVLFALFAMGCGKSVSPDGLPSLLPLTLTVTQEGIPLTEASLMLVPAPPYDGRNWAIGGITDQTGVARIYTHGKYPGAPEGTYKVIVHKIAVVAAVSYDDAPKDDIVALRQWEAEHAAELAQSKAINCIEKIYTNAETTPLEVTVSKGNTHYELQAGKAVEE